MKIAFLEDYEAVSEFAAQLVCRRINQARGDDKPFFVLGLPTGSTPLRLYEKLIELNKQSKVSFEKVKTFNMDEYIGIPQDHSQSYHSFMFHNFFQHINIDPNNCNIPNGNADDLEVECKRYEREIQAAGGIDLFIGGIGSDGHIAFNEPGSSLCSRTHVQSLTVETIRANARFFNNNMNQVPKRALTVGVGTIMDAKEVLILVNGAHKAFALHKVIECGISHMWTASVFSSFQNHKNTTFVCDEDSSVELKVKTVKHFKQMQDSQSF